MSYKKARTEHEKIKLMTYNTYSNAIKKRNKTTTKKINVCQLRNI